MLNLIAAVYGIISNSVGYFKGLSYKTTFTVIEYYNLRIGYIVKEFMSSKRGHG